MTQADSSNFQRREEPCLPTDDVGQSLVDLGRAGVEFKVYRDVEGWRGGGKEVEGAAIGSGQSGGCVFVKSRPQRAR